MHHANSFSVLMASSLWPSTNDTTFISEEKYSEYRALLASSLVNAVDPLESLGSREN